MARLALSICLTAGPLPARITTCHRPDEAGRKSSKDVPHGPLYISPISMSLSSLEGMNVDRTAVVSGVATVALAGALQTRPTVGALRDELVVAGGGRGE
eukprot:CAMPEP_0182522750 /NCGR_PEP_ID=MMETSP1323-20130603/526_1 /TAXON_ID=236787 /ORGANISM="Florenciella parvula, Strain RCC1693" /LENGTH=98 /DNA_ID=CAMNT_0024730951 /DNA_START=114 /DNA_END=407 /DNA_ORIENTATION=+